MIGVYSNPDGALNQWVPGVSARSTAQTAPPLPHPPLPPRSQSTDKTLAGQSVADQESQECSLSKQRKAVLQCLMKSMLWPFLGGGTALRSVRPYSAYLLGE